MGVAVQGGWAQTSATPPLVTPKARVVLPRHGMFGSSQVIKIKQGRDGSRALPDDPLQGFKAQVALPPQTLPFANFVGNTTVIAADASNGFMMARETDCSLTAFNVPFSYDASNPYTTYTSKTTDYGPMLHSEAGLTTTGGNFNGHCKDPSIGIGASDLLYAGMSTGGIRMSAVAAYDGTLGYNVLYTFAMQENGALMNSTVQTLPSSNQPYSVIAGDLNGDGNPDLVAVGWVNTTGTSTSAITILLGKSDGTFTVGQTYMLGAGVTDTAVLDDFNGDGKLDLVVPVGGGTVQFTNANGTLTFLPGNGDGTFGTPKTLSVAAEGLVSGDFNGDGKKDLASGTGAIFLGNGDGTFQQTSTPLFTKMQTNSNAGPQLAVGDFNKDGKLDIAAGTGVSIYIYLGNGDGTFNPGNIYAGIDNHGYLTATDLDGDGNLDLFSGNAQNGVFSGDDFSANLGQALMGHGDGTFAGAPQTGSVQFNTLQDVNGDGKLDFVGLTTQLISGQYVSTLGTYLGNGDGTFHQAGAALNPDVYTYQGTQYTPDGVSTYTVADLNGDGHPDIIYLPSFPYLNLNPARQGYLVALGNADGSYQAPTFIPAPTLSPGSPDNSNESVNNLGDLQGAVNQNGKFEIVYSFQTAALVVSTNTLTYYTGYATQVSNGDGTFAAPAVTITYSGPTGPTNPLPPSVVTVADLNGDKIPDIISYSPPVYANAVLTSPSTYQVMLGNSDGTFGTAANLPVTSSPQAAENQFGESFYPLAIGDVNGDGIPDVVAEGEIPVAGSTTGEFNYALGIALGKGDGTFNVQPPILVANTLGVAEVAVGDFTGDGKADIGFLSFGQGSNGIFVGNGDGTFQSLPSGYNDGTVIPALAIQLSTGQGNAGAFDLNGDGKISLVAGNTFFVPATAASTQLIPSTTALTASASSLVSGASLTLTATVTATTGSGTPTGTVTFLDGATSLGTGALSASGVATLSTTTLAVGSHSITAQYGGDSNYSASTSSAVSVTVTTAAATPAASTTTLAASATTATTGDNITFTATVAGPSGNTTVPTGTVTFLNGTTSLGTGTLNSSGVATLSTTALPVGADTITAQYGGDTNFSASTSAAVTVTVSAPAAPGFSISLSPNSATVTNGSSTTTTVSIQPSGGFSAAVSFACSGLPTGATCSFSPATVTPTGGTAATTTLTIATTSASAALAQPAGWPGFIESGRPVVAWGVLLLGMSGLVGRRRRLGKWMRGMQVLGVLAVLLGLASCGSSHHATTSTVTVTATSGSLSQSTTFSLTTK